MRSLNKKARMTIRLTSDQDRKAVDAAKVVSQQRGETVRPSTLIRELAMPGIDAILDASKNGK